MVHEHVNPPAPPREPEPLIIRPPTEAHSLLIRVTRGCKWNRCKFCGIYTHFGQPEFEVRPLEQIKADILAAREIYGADQRAAFLGDADPLVIDPDDMCRVLALLRDTFPSLDRITCYARASTCWVRREHLARFRQSGLSRLHVGLETGSDDLLRFHRKGVDRRTLISSGKAARQSGIELSYYVLLGLGGSDRCEGHIQQTLAVLNAVQPEFVRFRRLWIFGSEDGPRCPLWEDVQQGRFTPQTPEGTVHEMRAIISGIEFPAEIEAIHSNVFVPLKGALPKARIRLLSKIDGFLALPAEHRRARYSRPSVI